MEINYNRHDFPSPHLFLKNSPPRRCNALGVESSLVHYYSILNGSNVSFPNETSVQSPPPLEQTLFHLNSIEIFASSEKSSPLITSTIRESS